MSSRIEILNSSGYRSDGRRQHELRTLQISLTPQGTADGSCLLSHGLTQVSVNVFGPREAKRGERGGLVHDRAVLNVEICMAMFSAGERRRRGRGDKRILELAATVRSTFEPIIQSTLYPRTTIDINILILHQDGSLLPACINATSLALTSAGIPLLDFVCAISGGIHTASPILDLNALEENDVPGVVVGVMPRSGKVVVCVMETRLDVERVRELVRLGVEAGQVLFEEMRGAVRERTRGLVGAFEGGVTSGVVQQDDAMVGIS